MTTIRGLMLAQQQRHRPELEYREAWQLPGDAWCYQCETMYPCQDRVAADAVLATLDAAETVADAFRGMVDPGSSGSDRLVPDPEAS